MELACGAPAISPEVVMLAIRFVDWCIGYDCSMFLFELSIRAHLLFGKICLDI